MSVERISRVLVALVLGWMLSACTSGPPRILSRVERLSWLPQGAEVILDPVASLTRPDAKEVRHHGRGDEASMPMRMSHGVPVIDVRLNDVMTPLILDTGCQPTMMVDPASAAKAKVHVVKPARGGLVLEGTMGNEPALLGKIQMLKLAGWELEGPLCLIRSHQMYLGGSLVRRKMPLNLFGMALPLQVCSFVTIDYPGERVVFGFRRKYQPEKRGHVWSVPMILREGLPHIHLQHGGVKWEAIVDTGANPVLTITPEIARRCGAMSSLLEVEGYRVGIGVTSGRQSGHQLQRVILPQVHGLGPDLREAPATIADSAPRVGSGLLRHYRVTLDFKRQCLWLEEVEPQ